MLLVTALQKENCQRDSVSGLMSNLTERDLSVDPKTVTNIFFFMLLHFRKR